MKALLKKIIPDSVFDFRRRYLEKQMRDDLKSCVDANETFTKIYDGGYWGRSDEHGDKYFSGYGSHGPKFLDPYISAVNEFLLSLNEKLDVVDLGCGDFAVGSQIRPHCGNYVACDVVDGLIGRNRERYAKDGVDFRVVDIINGNLPKGDLVFLRQVLQHLSNSDIEKVVTKLSSGYRFLVLTEHLPLGDGFEPNLDQARGPDIRINLGKRGSGIILTESPFNLKVKQNNVLCEVFAELPERMSVVRTNLYRL